MQTMIILVRHGHVDGIDQPRFRGRQHLALTAAGMRQVEHTAALIARRARLDAVYSSPLTRCITTATTIGNAQGLAPQPDEDLIDLDYGEWQGRSHDDVLAKDGERARAWFADPATAPIPGGESLHALSCRAISAFKRIVGRHGGGTVAIVGHDTVNRALLLHALGLGLDHYRRLRQDPACVNVLLSDEALQVASLNETAHLDMARPGNVFGARR